MLYKVKCIPTTTLTTHTLVLCTVVCGNGCRSVPGRGRALAQEFPQAVALGAPRGQDAALPEVRQPYTRHTQHSWGLRSPGGGEEELELRNINCKKKMKMCIDEMYIFHKNILLNILSNTPYNSTSIQEITDDMNLRFAT